MEYHKLYAKTACAAYRMYIPVYRYMYVSLQDQRGGEFEYDIAYMNTVGMLFTCLQCYSQPAKPTPTHNVFYYIV